MLYDLILQNGHVIDPLHKVNKKQDIAIKDGKIAALGKDLGHSKQTIDLEGKVVFPGVIDMHTHVGRIPEIGIGAYQMIAETGVTTTIDFAGPIDSIKEDLKYAGSGLNIGSIEAMIPGEGAIHTENPSSSMINDFIHESLEKGSLGLKLFGGHSPLTPEATEEGMRLANDLKVMVAYHAGSTATKSDMTGMREAIEMAKGKQLLLAHINAYIRGHVDHPMEELKEALNLLKENKNIFSDAHLAVMNAAKGLCKNGVPEDHVARVCLNLYGFPETEDGLEEAIKNGVARVMKKVGLTVRLVSGEEALQHWKKKETNTSISFPVNLPTVATGCLIEKDKPGGDFIIQMASTDGGGIPRNNLVKRVLSFYHLGYITLEEVVEKTSLNPAKIFGLKNKGHLGVDADADLTIIDLNRSEAVMSIIDGALNMIDGTVLRNNGKLLVTESGVKSAEKANLNYEVIDFKDSTFYENIN